jgi:hypothetical protein
VKSNLRRAGPENVCRGCGYGSTPGTLLESAYRSSGEDQAADHPTKPDFQGASRSLERGS